MQDESMCAVCGKETGVSASFIARVAEESVAAGLMTPDEIAIEMSKPDGFILLPRGSLMKLAVDDRVNGLTCWRCQHGTEHGA